MNRRDSMRTISTFLEKGGNPRQPQKETLRNLIRELGISQAQFCRQCGITERTLQRLFKNRRMAQPYTVTAICRELDISYEYYQDHLEDES